MIFLHHLLLNAFFIVPLHFKCNSFLSKTIPALSFIPCGRVHACSELSVLPPLSHSSSESGMVGVMLCSSETSLADSILQYYLWYTPHGLLCKFLQLHI